MRPTITTTFASVTFAVLLAACAAGPTEDASSEGPGASGQRGSGPGAAQPVETKPVPGVDLTTSRGGAPGSAAAADAAGIPTQRTVYFDFDRFDIRPEFRPVVEAHAQYLREHRDARTLVQGSADERGSREYNVGLGQRRAEAVKSMLVLLGAEEKQVEAVSLGEEKPVCTESTESCWERNRRADVRYGNEY